MQQAGHEKTKEANVTPVSWKRIKKWWTVAEYLLHVNLSCLYFVFVFSDIEWLLLLLSVYVGKPWKNASGIEQKPN